MTMHCQRCGGVTEEREHEGRLRPVCRECGAATFLDPKVAVAVVISRDDRILLGKRAQWTRSPGTWSLPAGFVDRGELVESAATREALEETGLAVTIGPVLGVFSEPGEPVILIAFPAVTAIGEPTPGDDLIELAWFLPDELPELAFGHDAQVIQLWQAWRESRRAGA